MRNGNYPDQGVLTRREALKAMAIGSLGIALVACGQGGSTSTGFSERFAAYSPAPEPNVDPSKVVWPDYVTQAGPEVRKLYEFQLQHGDLMRYIPCFCGCKNDGHRSNRDCYVQAVNPDGSVVFDPMAPT